MLTNIKTGPLKIPSLKLLIITPWKEEWFKDEIYSYPEILYLKRELRKHMEYEVISVGEKPSDRYYHTLWCQSEIPYSYARELIKDIKVKKFVVSIYGIFERFPLRPINRILYPFHLWRYRKLDLAFKGGADLYLITDDGSLGDRLAEKYKVNHIILPNPRPEYKKLDKIESRRILNLPLNETIGAFVGRNSKFKGVQFLPKIYKKGNPYTLILVGSGLKASLQPWAEENKSIIIEQFPHHMMNIVYSAVDFVMMPYIYGNKTAVMIECLTYGLPTVSFKAHSTDEIIRNGENGFIARNFNVKEFRDYCIKLASDETLRESISLKAKETSKNFPTWKEHTDKIINNLK